MNPLQQPTYPTKHDNDLVASELERWLHFLRTDPDGYRKIRALLGERVEQLRAAEFLQRNL